LVFVADTAQGELSGGVQEIADEEIGIQPVR